MSLLFETICVQNGALQRLSYHQERINKSQKQVFGIIPPIDLYNILVPKFCENGVFRCRVSYAETIDVIDFIAYQSREISLIKLVEAPEIQYNLKWENRSVFQELLTKNQAFSDVIITQNNYITDSTFANLAFFDGLLWHTPSTYLLEGTKRGFLINNQQLIVSEIKTTDLKRFKAFAMINAMRDYTTHLPLPINLLIF